MHTGKRKPLITSLISAGVLQLLSSVLGLLQDGASVSMIPTVHLLATVVNTYLTRNHISWPAFTTALKGFVCLQKKMYQEAEKCLQSAILQYEENVGPQHLLTIETQLYYASCKQFTDVKGALRVLECAQQRLDAMSYTNHFLSAKVSYRKALLYQQVGKKEQEREYIMDTQRKIHSYCGSEHPWAADLMLKTHVDSDQKNHGTYVDIYRKLIQRETNESKLFAVETEVSPFIRQWKQIAEQQSAAL